MPSDTSTYQFVTDEEHATKLKEAIDDFMFLQPYGTTMNDVIDLFCDVLASASEDSLLENTKQEKRLGGGVEQISHGLSGVMDTMAQELAVGTQSGNTQSYSLTEETHPELYISPKI